MQKIRGVHTEHTKYQPCKRNDEIVESAALACGLWTALDALDACALVSLFIPLNSRYAIIIISTGYEA
jgi:hypothetical protein